MALAKTNTKIYESEASKQLNMQIVSAGNSKAPYSIAYSGAKYAFVGFGESSVQYSTDGESFETAFLTFNAYDVIYSENKEAFIIVGSRTVGSLNCPIIVSTADFSSFTDLYNPGEITDNIGMIYGIFEIGSRFFTLAEYKGSEYLLKAISFDTTFSVESDFNVYPVYSSSICSFNIVKGNNRFLVEIRKTSQSREYTDSIFCISISGANSASYSTYSNTAKLLGYANGYFFAKLPNISLAYTVDGRTWNTITNDISESLDAVVYLNREYLFICEGKICRRNDIAITGEDVFSKVAGLPKTGPGVVVNDAAYLLGNTIIKLAAEDPDPTIEADKLSATQALKLSKDYSDELYDALDARVSALEGN